MLTGREKKILELIRADPMASQQQIAIRLGISRSSVAQHIMNLTHKGAIRGRGYVLEESPYVCVIGGANVDIIGSIANKTISADSNPGSTRVFPGGVARNIAENLHQLGIDSRLFAPIGNDAHGELIRSGMARAGMDCGYLHIDQGASTSTYMAIMDSAGELELGLSDMAIMNRFSPSELEQHANTVEGAVLIVVDANLSEQTLGWVFSHRGSTPVFADPVSVSKCLRLEPYLDQVTLLKPSLAEAAALAGIRLRNRRQAPRIASTLLDRGVRQVCVSMGGHGLYFGSDEFTTSMDATLTDEPSSVSGAGDALMAGLILAHMNGWSPSKALVAGQSAASITLASRGSNSPDLSLAALTRITEERLNEVA